MHKCISHKYTLSLPFSLTYIPWPWITPPLSCENVGRLPYLSEPHFFVKWGSHIFGSGVALEGCVNFPGSWLRTCQEAGVHWKRSDRSTGCSSLPTSRSQSRFLRGAFPAVLLGVGHPDANHSPVLCLLPEVRFHHAGDRDWALQLSELSRKNPLTQHPSWAVCLHWGFSAEESRGGLPCSVFNRNQAKPNPQNKASKLTSDTSDLYSLHLTVTQLGLLPLLVLSSLMQSPVLLFPPQEQCKFFLLCRETFLKFIYLAVPELSCSTWGLCRIFHLLCSMQDSSSLPRDLTWTPYLGIMAF